MFRHEPPHRLPADHEHAMYPRRTRRRTNFHPGRDHIADPGTTLTAS